MNANWGGRAYSEQDIMHAVAPIEQNLKLLNWQSKVDLDEGILIFKNEVENNG